MDTMIGPERDHSLQGARLERIRNLRQSLSQRTEIRVVLDEILELLEEIEAANQRRHNPDEID